MVDAYTNASKALRVEEKYLTELAKERHTAQNIRRTIVSSYFRKNTDGFDESKLYPSERSNFCSELDGYPPSSDITDLPSLDPSHVRNNPITTEIYVGPNFNRRDDDRRLRTLSWSPSRASERRRRVKSGDSADGSPTLTEVYPLFCTEEEDAEQTQTFHVPSRRRLRTLSMASTLGGTIPGDIHLQLKGRTAEEIMEELAPALAVRVSLDKSVGSEKWHIHAWNTCQCNVLVEYRSHNKRSS